MSHLLVANSQIRSADLFPNLVKPLHLLAIALLRNLGSCNDVNGGGGLGESSDGHAPTFYVTPRQDDFAELPRDILSALPANGTLPTKAWRFGAATSIVV